MKIKLELFGASRDFSEKDFLEFNLKEKMQEQNTGQLQKVNIRRRQKLQGPPLLLILSSTFCPP